MIKEQEEAIKEIKTYMHDYTMESFDDDGYTRYEISEEEQNFFNNIDKLLNLLKEKDAEIEKRDKMIDLMAERINWLCKTNGILLDKEHEEDFNEEDIKQYFERKVEDE
jgi:hypothetical protein